MAKFYSGGVFESPKLAQNQLGLAFKNPVGLAAGFDKNAQAINDLSGFGFGFLECGTVTPKSQPGNPTPRLFRLVEDEAVINRLGFNNGGLTLFCRNFAKRSAAIPVGANIGKNKTQQDAIADYVEALQAVNSLADYVTVNISSPNTEGLRDLQAGDALTELLSALKPHRQKPLLLKVAPDLEAAQIEHIANAVLEHKLDGLIVSNTTLARPSTLKSQHKAQTGGLSGKPLCDKSNQVLKQFSQATEGKILLVGVGGIASGADAYAKIKAGASLVQLYTALVYQGPAMINRINRELAELLAQDGYGHISDAIGVDVAS